MSTFTATANDLACARGPGATTWYRDESAVQGSPSSAGNPRVGVIMYKTLRSSVAWADMKINEVRLTVRYGSLGYSQRKTLRFYSSSRNSVGGSGREMLGTSFGQVRSAINARSASETITFNGSTNADVFAKMADWITTGTTYGLCIYLNEMGTSTRSSDNYLNITSSSIAIDYELRGSSGTVEPATVDVKDSVTLSISPIESEQVVTHAATFALGNHSSGAIGLAGGVNTYDYTIPVSWLAEMSGVTSAQAKCTLVTYEGGVERGTREIPFTVHVPDAYSPVINSFSVRRYTSRIDDYGQTVYEESLAGNHVWVNLNAHIDHDGGDNTGTATLEYWPESDDTDVTAVNITWTNDALVLTHDRSVITAVVPPSDAYVFRLTASNGHVSTTATGRVELAWAPFHIAGSGYGVGIGKYSTGTETHKRFEVAWPAYFDNVIANIQAGELDEAVSVASGAYEDVDIDFDLPYSVPPVVVAGFLTGSTAGTFGRCCVAVLQSSVTETGFTARIFNGDTTTRVPRICWIAYGIPA